MEILLNLLFAFFQIGLWSIGGGYAIIPLIQEQVVVKHAWISQKVFTDIITISQMTPGPLAVNTSTFVGLKIAGIPGAVLATFGCILAGICIAVLLYRFFRNHQKSIYVSAALDGLKSASVGLIMSAGAAILLLTFTGASEIRLTATIEWSMVLLFTGAFLVLRKFRWNPILLMVVSGMIGGILYH